MLFLTRCTTRMFYLTRKSDEWNNKAAGIVSYGSAGGARAAEHLRGILGELLLSKFA